MDHALPSPPPLTNPPQPSAVAHLLKYTFTSPSPPRHVDPRRYTLNISRRVYETANARAIDNTTSGPLLLQLQRGVVRPPRVAAKSQSNLKSNSKPGDTNSSLPPPLFLPPDNLPSEPDSSHSQVFSALKVLKQSRQVKNSFVSMPAISFVAGSSTPSTATRTTTKTPTTDDTKTTKSLASTPETATYSLRSLTKKFSAPQLSQPSSTSANGQEALTPPATTPRRSKPLHFDNPVDQQNSLAEDAQRTSIFRRLSPALAARVKLLNGSSDANLQNRGKNTVGKIPQDHLRELDSLHQDLSIKVEKRGRAWPGLQLKRERSAPDLLQSPTKTEIASPQEVTIDKESSQQTPAPVQPETPPETPSETQPETPPETQPETQTQSQHEQPSPSCSRSGIKNIDDTHDSVDGAAASTMTAVQPAMTEERSSSIPQDVELTQEGSTDLEEYLRRSTLEDQPPPLPPKDTPPAPSTPSSANVVSYFSPRKLNRAESIYSFSRASFSNQLSQLTSINLPQPAALEASISSIINAPTAVRALVGAAEQIEAWMNKASDVLNGLDADDDVEWAAAGGREGLEEVDKAVVKFESLVDVYVKAIENVQLRDDIDDVRTDDLTLIVSQMDSTLKNWANIRNLLRGVKAQVELAMEWEELWNNVLGDVGLEIDNLTRLIFEMEEKRHKSLAPDSEGEPGPGLDINELETIVEESPFQGTPSSSAAAANKRLSLALFPPADSSNPTAGNSNPQDDANLMQLFARMQPLRASLDFLPMRLSMFHARAERLFPTACDELEQRKTRLEATYKKLENDAEALRRELGEDRWILVFRNAGKQAQKMCDSVERSIAKLQESLETGDAANNPTAINKKIESYEAKKSYYVPAIGRVMTIIQKGVNDRLTVNGEVLTLLSDMNQRVDALKASMQVMDVLLEETPIPKTQQLRDSISSIITADSPANTSLLGTPGSSPASSVIMTGYSGGLRTPNAGAGAGGSSRRGSSVGSASRSVTTNSRRLSGIPTVTSNRKSSSASLSVNSPTHSATTPTPVSRTSRLSSAPALNRPRWNASTNTNDLDTGHNFRSHSRTSPSPYKTSLPVPSGRTSRSASSSLPVPSPLSRATSSSPVPSGRASSRLHLRSNSRLGAASPTSPSMTAKTSAMRSSMLDPPPYSKLRKSTANLPTGLRNRQSYGGPMRIQIPDEEATQTTRPGTSLGHSSRRTSLLPQMKGKTGRESAAGQRNGNNSSSNMDERPRWR